MLLVRVLNAEGRVHLGDLLLLLVLNIERGFQALVVSLHRGYRILVLFWRAVVVEIVVVVFTVRLTIFMILMGDSLVF